MNDKKPFASLLALAAVSAVAYQLADTQDDRAVRDAEERAAQPGRGTAAGLPIAAFRRKPGPQDSLPRALRTGLARFQGGQSPADVQVRRLLSIDRVSVFAIEQSGRLCLGHITAGAGVAMTCNDVPGLKSGFLFSGSGRRLVGLVPDGVKNVVITDRKGSRHVIAARGNAYVYEGLRARRLAFGNASVNLQGPPRDK